MKKLSLERWVGKCAVPNNPELAQYEMMVGMTSEQRFHEGLPVEFPTRDTFSGALQYEREARKGRERAYRRLLRNY